MQDFKIAIPCSQSIVLKSVSSILRCEGMQHHTKVFLSDGEMLVSICNLGAYRKSLANHGFFSSHKSHLFNINYMKNYSKKGYVEMTDSSTVPVSRRKKEAFLKEVIGSFDALNYLGIKNI